MNTFGFDGGKRRLGETVLALVIERVRGKGGTDGVGRLGGHVHKPMCPTDP